MEIKVVGRGKCLMEKYGDRVKDLMEEGLSVWLTYAST